MKTRRHAVAFLTGLTLAVALSLAPAATLWATRRRLLHHHRLRWPPCSPPMGICRSASKPITARWIPRSSSSHEAKATHYFSRRRNR